MTITLVDPFPGAARSLAWIPRGGDGTDSTAVEDTTDETDTTDDNEDDEDTEDADATTVSKADFDKLQASFSAMQKQLSAADKNKAAAQKALDELQRKEKSELENAKADVVKLTADADGWREKFTTQAVTNAFLRESMEAGIAWHNAALAQQALGAVEVGEDGVIADMPGRIKALAKEQPFLVKKTSEGDGTNDNSTKSASGSNVGSKGGKGKGNGQLSEEELMRRFPALKR